MAAPPIRSAGSARRLRRAGTTGIHYALLILLAFLSFAVVLLMLSLSFRSGITIIVAYWRLIPWPPYLGNYEAAAAAVASPTARTLYVAAVSIAGVVAVSAPASFAFARMRFPGSGAAFALIIAVMAIPGIILLTPDFILANQLRLAGSLWSLIVFYIAGGIPFAVFLTTTFFRAQPRELFEAAFVDGATDMQALVRVAIPLAFPILVTIAVLNFLGIYGDFIWPTLMLSQHNETLLMALQQFTPTMAGLGSAEPNYGGESAAYLLGSLPQLVIFVLGMRYFVQGLTSGAVKA
jgi:ABC-type glycerol-3-phosphate transport system permease component